MEIIRFAHDYDKLKFAVFPTVRGKTSITKYPVGSTVSIKTPSWTGSAKILDAQWRKIEDLPLSFIKHDGNYPGYEIRDHWDFVKLLNSFRRFNKITSIEQVVTVFWVQLV